MVKLCKILTTLEIHKRQLNATLLTTELSMEKLQELPQSSMCQGMSTGQDAVALVLSLQLRIIDDLTVQEVRVDQVQMGDVHPLLVILQGILLMVTRHQQVNDRFMNNFIITCCKSKDYIESYSNLEISCVLIGLFYHQQEDRDKLVILWKLTHSFMMLRRVNLITLLKGLLLSLCQLWFPAP